jgi:hypothetical protein
MAIWPSAFDDQKDIPKIGSHYGTAFHLLLESLLSIENLALSLIRFQAGTKLTL